jgi:hypothetical protein
MKPFIQKTAAIVLLTVTFLATSFTGNAQKLVYKKTYNSSIGITVENAAGASFTIKDKTGTVVMQGKVKDNKTFYIPTGKMNTGDYKFYIGNMAIQEFSVAK